MQRKYLPGALVERKKEHNTYLEHLKKKKYLPGTPVKEQYLPGTPVKEQYLPGTPEKEKNTAYRSTLNIGSLGEAALNTFF